VKNTFFERNIIPIPQLAKLPEAERQSLICCNPRFAVEHEGMVGPLWFGNLERTPGQFLFKLPRVCSHIDVLRLSIVHLLYLPFVPSILVTFLGSVFQQSRPLAVGGRERVKEHSRSSEYLSNQPMQIPLRAHADSFPRQSFRDLPMAIQAECYN
jgi:hypothetical protein